MFQSGNDIVLALANNNGDIGYIGWVPAFIADTSGHQHRDRRRQRGGGHECRRQLAEHPRQGVQLDSHSADLAGKTIAVNALKGVGEVAIRAAFKKLGIEPDSSQAASRSRSRRCVRRSPTARSTRSGRPSPSTHRRSTRRRPDRDGAGAGGYALPPQRHVRGTQGVDDRRTRLSPVSSGWRIDESLIYAQGHPDEIRALLPAASRDVRLPVWSPILDRGKLLQLARYAREFGAISTPAGHHAARTGDDLERRDPEGRASARRRSRSSSTSRQSRRSRAGTDTFAVVRPVVQAELPPQGPRRRSENERRRRRGRSRGRSSCKPGHVPLLLRREADARRDPSRSS